MRSLHFVAALVLLCPPPASGRHSSCYFHLELQREEEECLQRLKKHELLPSKGCQGIWDKISCWDHAEVGETVTIPCPKVLQSLFGRNGNISKNCTVDGWSEVFPNITSACESETKQEKLIFYMLVKTLYTLGHSLSLVALMTGSAILCMFRKLHCTRNYIHLNLFFSFILRAVAVLVKDEVLFSHNSKCSEQPSLLGCRVSIVFFHYFVMANFFWLLVEGLYLHMLLVAIFSENKHFIVYLLIGWGFPTVVVFAWILARIYMENTGCWEMNENATPKWVIYGPVMFSNVVNFILFISIIRILVQKLRCPNLGGNDPSQYRRLAKSTLLLIPLFGVNYVVFVSLTDSMPEYKIFFDLAIGSFQGLVVAILYCFLNSEVQGEIKRKWGSISTNCRVRRDYGFQGSCMSHNGPESSQGFERNSRAQSFLQTETTVL
ncbi:vasoactive intestinal polypeptide receptor 2 [Arapaima gigas]